MKGPTHALIGTTGTLAACAALSLAPDATMLLVGGAALCSKLPDIDQRWPLSLIIRHRGPTHHWAVCLALAALGALSAVTWPLWGLLGAGGAAGYALHVAADACTLNGVPGTPWRKRIHLLPRRLRFETGDSPEAVLATFVALGFVVLMYMQAAEIAQTYGG